ncbi:hypothetical protein AWE51_22950 [Aquimarina aggregata]|uniref:DUF4760 domain-containing protein n=1 Tax=Aquimarina aggregata TaxID=1642818 RepID=A0A163BCY0_9FLAO|nr:hypothetical protein [Aquimarina aggregata]KZS41265.1 hypothetical protein AWE51_22950 [Aquimarina aggregata]
MTQSELIIKSLTSVVTLAGILIGVYQFNKGQRKLQENELEQRAFELKKIHLGNQFEAISKFKEIQSIKYKETTETISSIIYADDYQSKECKHALKRFWQLYWVELSAVEDREVEAKMVELGEFIKKLQKVNFKNISTNDKKQLYSLGYSVAQTIKKSSKTWELPEGFKKQE